MTGSFAVTRRAVIAGAVGAALSAPMVNKGSYAFAAAPGRAYSRRAVDLVASSLVIDMLAPLKITLSADYITHRLTDAEATEFKASGITGFHNAYGLGGPDAKEQALTFLAGWQGFAGRNSHVFTLVDGVADLYRAKAEKNAPSSWASRTPSILRRSRMSRCSAASGCAALSSPITARI
ncbi:MAG: hypothetical protein ACK4PC_04350 [Sphingopyxis sp.]